MCTNEQKTEIFEMLKNNLFDLSIHMYGCRVIQKIIEVCPLNDIKKYLIHLRQYISDCIEDQNGNHVIQKIIEKLPKGDHTEIIKVVQGRIFYFSCHQYGCRVIQRVFEYCSEDEKLKN